jgi:hypothetical protein
MKRDKKYSMNRNLSLMLAVMLLAVVGTLSSCDNSQKAANTATTQTVFSTPDEAGKALQAASKTKNESKLAEILGANSKPILSSGDPAEDAAALDSFTAKFDQMNRWVSMTDGNRVLYIGADNYAFPIPLTLNSSAKWYFNTKAGEDEILARRIGKNELRAIDACYALANAEEIYFKKPRNGDPGRRYTTLIISSAGKQDGLYWQTPADKEASPLGRVEEFAKGAISTPASESVVLDGYSFRILGGQGENAKGGAKDYTANGKMTGGFAVVATPVKYQDSGIMTFIMNREGVVYQKDLGLNTANAAAAIKVYDPAADWDEAD